MSKPSKLRFPQFAEVRLHQFSLYTLQPDVQVTIGDGVYCLAGANGLGKSTFLATLNFGLTGIVPDPKREFKSVKEYAQFGSGFSAEFFTGRIAENDRDDAAISIVFDVGDHRYELTRGIFEPGQLRSLCIRDGKAGFLYQDGPSTDDSDDLGAARQQEYENHLTRDVGLDSFEQFVFLQHFVLTFDESRHLLLWDQKVLTQALYLSIGADYTKAERADRVRRDMERADSRARNRNYAASNVRTRIQSLRDALRGPSVQEEDLSALRQEHQRLTEAVLKTEQDTERKRSALNDAHLRWMEISSESTALQAEYARAFAERVQSRVRVEFHPTIAASLSQGECAVCGTLGDSVRATITEKIDRSECPLCESHLIKKPADPESLTLLRRLDSEIAQSRSRLETSMAERNRIELELRALEDRLAAQKSELSSFESENEAAIAHMATGSSGIATALRQLQEEMAELLRQKQAEYNKRDEKRKELLKLQRDLQNRYLEAELEFVPLFRNLASLFLGIDLEIRLDVSTSTSAPGLSLVLDMRGQTRREVYQMSESQRFFVDIALRMALAQYMSDSATKAPLLVDTPEGSLDIAYESKAGQMFARFVETGHDLIMTANINSSELLLRLAAECGRDKMKLQRMTSWTELSDVQLSGEELFDQAYTRIEDALDVRSEALAGRASE